MPSKKNTPPRSDDEHDSSAQRNQSVEEELPLPHQQQSDSDGSAAADSGEEDEYITVQLADIHKELQCPICLGIIRNTRTVMECLHRFCRKCIDKAMRLGNNECPACRTHCASRRSLRDDPNYDALISVFYPDIDKYEEEELAFHDEERARNKQIQASIAQTVHRQSEALGKKRSSARATAAAYARRSKVYRSSRLEGSRFSQTSLAAGTGSVDGGDENDSEVNRDSLGASTGLVGNCEMLAWGRGGIRSSSRQSSLSVGNGKNARNVRVHKLIDAIQREAQNDVVDVQFILVPLDEQRIPSLLYPHMCCSPTVSMRQLCQYVGLETDVDAEEVEILLVRGLHSESGPLVTPAVSISGRAINPCKDELHILEEHETLSELQAMYTVNKRDLVFAYRKKSSASLNSV